MQVKGLKNGLGSPSSAEQNNLKLPANEAPLFRPSGQTRGTLQTYLRPFKNKYGNLGCNLSRHWELPGLRYYEGFSPTNRNKASSSALCRDSQILRYNY